MIYKSFAPKMAQDKARIWPCLPHVFQVRSTVDETATCGWVHSFLDQPLRSEEGTT